MYMHDLACVLNFLLGQKKALSYNSGSYSSQISNISVTWTHVRMHVLRPHLNQQL